MRMPRGALVVVRIMCGFLPAFMLMSAHTSVIADEVVLRDGEVIDGEIISEPGAEQVQVRLWLGASSATRTIPRAQVARLQYGVSPRLAVARELQRDHHALSAQATASAEAWWALAERYRAADDVVGAKQAATNVIARDRHHRAARQVLGYVQHAGLWLRRDEMALAQGLLWYRGAWVSWQERERREQETRQAAEQRRQEQIAQAERAERRREREAPELALSVAPMVYSSSFYRSPYYAPGRQVFILRDPCPAQTTVSTSNGWGFAASRQTNNWKWSIHWNQRASDTTVVSP